MGIKDSGALVVAGVSLMLMLLNAWMNFRPPAEPASQWQLPRTWRGWSAACIRLALVVAAIWIVYMFTRFNWQMVTIALVSLFTMYMASIRWKLPLTLLWWGILYCVLQYPTAFSAQLLWLAPQLTMMVLLWRLMLPSRSDHEPYYAFFYLPFWLGLLVVGAVADMVLRLDDSSILSVVSGGLDIMQPPELDTFTLGVTLLFYTEQLFSVGAITLYTSFMLVGVLAVWARRLNEPILVALPLFGWIVAVALSLAFGWPLAALPVAVAMVLATVAAAWVANIHTIVFPPKLWL